MYEFLLFISIIIAVLLGGETITAIGKKKWAIATQFGLLSIITIYIVHILL
jgi:hypothetical protein